MDENQLSSVLQCTLSIQYIQIRGLFSNRVLWKYCGMSSFDFFKLCFYFSSLSSVRAAFSSSSMCFRN